MYKVKSSENKKKIVSLFKIRHCRPTVDQRSTGLGGKGRIVKGSITREWLKKMIQIG